MQLLWAILVLFSLSNIVHGQTPSEAELTVEERLIRANDRKTSAVQEIDKIPNRVDDEVARIMTKLDSLFRDQKGQMQERFDEHYEKVGQSLQTVSLPEDESNWKVAWRQYKAVFGDSDDLTELVKNFNHQAWDKIKPLREELAKYINSPLTAELQQAQNTIRAPFQEILVHYFPVWDVPNLRAPLLPGMQKEDWSNIPLAGVSGLLLVLTRRVVKQIITRLSIKVGGKGLGKFIPFVGFALLVIEGRDILWAKADLEHELRKEVRSAYEEEFSPTILLNRLVGEGELSTRQRLEQRLQAWSDHCRKEVERILDVARVFTLSPDAKDYIAEQTQKGHNTQEIVEYIHQVGEVFGQYTVAHESLGYLRKRIVDDPEVVDVADIVDQAYRKNPEVARACLHQWSVRTWAPYRDDPDRFKALWEVAAYRLEQQTAHDFAREIGERDELTPIFVDVGLYGVRIWDKYAGPAAGQHQRKIAKDAIALLKKNYPYKDLLTREGLAEAQKAEAQKKAQLDESSLLGEVLSRVKSLTEIVYYGAVVLVLLAIAALARPLLRRLLPGNRSAPPPRKLEPQ